MEASYYRVTNWDDYFEKSDIRKCKMARWVAVPNKHDGKGYRRLTFSEHRCEIFTAWILILQVASKMPRRGSLYDEDGPLSAEDLSVMTGFPARIFEMAFLTLTGAKIGWLEKVNGRPSGCRPDAVRMLSGGVRTT